MKILEFLEKDKDHLLTELTRAGTPEKAVRVVEAELDKLLLKYNEQAGSERERDAAAHMITALRHAAPLVDTAGESKVWEMKSGETKKRKINPIALLLLIAGLACAGLTFIFMNGITPKIGMTAADIKILQPASYLLLATAVCLMLFGFLRKIGTGERGSRKQQVEIKVDPEKVYRSLRTAILSVDQSLEEIQSAERWAKREQAGSLEGKEITPGEIDLFADLLTAAYSKDGEYVLDKIEDLKYYLHKQQIEVVDFSEETKQYFDLMPGKDGGTIRPALVADGKVLKKGLASRGK